jgi:3-methyladenine DNA glycosylase/8-oxoguanine DNA glycosylase
LTKSLDQDKLDKALSQLRLLEIDKALFLFYQLLDEHPTNLDLLSRIYPLEKRKRHGAGFKKLAMHIFEQQCLTQAYHKLVIETYRDYQQKLGSSPNPENLTAKQVYNLFFHLGKTTFQTEIDSFCQHIKSKLADSPKTAEALLIYCEQLIEKKSHLQAKKELHYLIVYYTEAATIIPAEKLFNKLA